MLYALLFMTALCFGLIGFIIGERKPRSKPVDNMSKEQKEREKELAEHIMGMMDYDVSQAYKGGKG